MQDITIPSETRPITEAEEVALGFTARRGMLDLDVYTLDDICERLGLTEVTVRSHVRAGRLKAVRFGGATGFRFLRHDIYAWLIGMQVNLRDGAKPAARGQDIADTTE